MQILRVRLENFMAHKETDIDCTQFRSALIVGRINGNPRKSNGVGKSTIFRAIYFALYGEADVKLERIVRRGVDRCLVLLEFELDGTVYRIIRKRIKKNAELEMWVKSQSDWTNISQKTTSQTEEELAKLIRISSVAFQHSVLFAQGSLAGLASATATARKNLLKEPFHLAVYGKYEKAAKEKTSILSKETDKLKLKIETIGNPEEIISNLNSELSEAQLKLARSETASEALSWQVGAAKNKLDELKKIKVEDPVALKTQRDSILRELSSIRKKNGDIQSIIDKDDERVLVATNSIAAARKVLATFETSLVELNSKSDRNREEIRTDIDKMISKEIEGKTFVAKLKSDYEAYQIPLPEGSTCDHCRQEISADHRKTCDAERSIKLVKISDDMLKYKGMLETVKAKKSKFEIELSTLESNNTSRQNLENRISAKKTEIEQNSNLLKQICETISSRKKEIETIIAARDDLEKQAKDIAEQLKAKTNESLKNDIAVATDLITTLETQHRIAKNEANDVAASISIFKEKIKDRQSDKEKLEILRTELMQTEKELRLRLKVQQAFSPSGIPTMIINTILDDLQIETNDLLAQINSGIELLFLVSKTKGDKEEDTLDIIYRINGEEFEWKELSGGKQMMVSLCLKLALSLIIQRRVNVVIKFLMLDEVESQFDDETKDAFLALVKKWQEKFTIFVVTHNNQLKDKFSHAIMVEGDSVNEVTGKLVSSW